jgi:hypothetical protein
VKLGSNGMMKKVLILTALAEGMTGLALLLVPSFVGRLLLGEAFTGVGIVSGRVAGIALIALGVACWPGPPVAGMLIYSASVALYLAYVGIVVGLTGIVFWPAVVIHLVLAVLLAGGSMKTPRSRLIS